MPNVLDPFRFVVIAVAGWMNQKQQHAIEYLREENRVLREQLGTRRLRFTDDQRRRLATRAKLVGRRLLNDVANIVTPDTLLPGTVNWSRTSMMALPSEDLDGRAPPAKLKTWWSAWLRRIGIGAIGGFSVPCPISATVSPAEPSANILRRHGVEPAPERIQKTTWKEFLSQHW